MAPSFFYLPGGDGVSLPRTIWKPGLFRTALRAACGSILHPRCPRPLPVATAGGRGRACAVPPGPASSCLAWPPDPARLRRDEEVPHGSGRDGRGASTSSGRRQAFFKSQTHKTPLCLHLQYFPTTTQRVQAGQLSTGRHPPGASRPGPAPSSPFNPASPRRGQENPHQAPGHLPPGKTKNVPSSDDVRLLTVSVLCTCSPHKPCIGFPGVHTLHSDLQEPARPLVPAGHLEAKTAASEPRSNRSSPHHPRRTFPRDHMAGRG